MPEPSKRPTKLRQIEQQIDENLKRAYSEDVSEAVPDRFLELLQKLREQE